jgi:hypothetical protein
MILTSNIRYAPRQPSSIFLMSQFILPPTEYSSNIFGSNSCKKNILYFLLAYILERDQELWSSCVSDRYKGTNLIKGASALYLY